ncbi:MAG: hypothetical protein ACKOOG_08115 [Actinomycetota bacterium]
MSDRPRGPKYGTIDRDYAIRLATTPPENDGPIWMLNLMRYREVAEYRDGRESGISGQEADDAYAPTDVLRDIGAEVAFFADVVEQVRGEEPAWHRVAVVRYPTRKSFIDMQTRNDFQEKHEHKEAGMERTIVMGTRPLADPVTVDLASRTADDVVVLRVQRRTDYTPTAAGSFAIEGTIVGDGRTWDHAHYERFPSHAAATTALAAEAEDPAIADAYVLVVRPRIDRIHPGR